jgi:hypothetical protein
VVCQWGSLCFNALLSSTCRQQCSSSWSHSTRQQPTRRLRPAAAADTGAPAAEQEQQPDPPAVEQRTIKLRKPVGVVFAQNKGGPVFVEELTAGGNADKSGAVQVCLGGSLFLRTGPGRSRIRCTAPSPSGPSFTLLRNSMPYQQYRANFDSSSRSGAGR